MQKPRDMFEFEVALITGKRVRLTLREATRIFIHPWVLIIYSLLSMLTVFMDAQPWTHGMQFWLRTAIYFLSSVIGLSAAWLTILILAMAVRAKVIKRVHSIIFDLSGSLFSLLTTKGLVTAMGSPPDTCALVNLMLYAYYSVIIVHVSLFLWSVLIPRMLADMRQAKGRVQDVPQRPENGAVDLPETGPLALNKPVSDTGGEIKLLPGATDMRGNIVINGKTIPVASICHILAQGNYVRISGADRDYFEAGPHARGSVAASPRIRAAGPSQPLGQLWRHS